MIGGLRATVALTGVAVVTPPMMLAQWVAVRTGLFSDRVLPPIWHRFILKVLGIRLHVVGEIVRDRPLLIASNHVSWTDIMVAGATAPVNFIAKSEISRWPLGGTLARLQRTVFVERDRRRASGDQAGEVAERLVAGDAIVLFAEGTTGDGNLMLPFKTTLFGAASMTVDAGRAGSVAIQPMAIVYTRFHGMPMNRQGRMRASWIGDSALVPHLMGLLKEGAVDVEVHFGEPVEYHPGSSRKQVAQEIERRVRELFVSAQRQPQVARQSRRARALPSRPERH
ncbi:MAG: 1-acyl-sn-glycerol-3-phosphate acyltransferase [Rhizobiales bacterium]|nr:1-acyl-sn-glycerol-3-phosphate acyltransferase [Hyphomicrobiales bacterium]OJU31973.1 MAG: 1-acyl-sn-glycerol-3-phosphate acyltransferase [Rhizobiales bacterium 68-8]